MQDDYAMAGGFKVIERLPTILRRLQHCLRGNSSDSAYTELCAHLSDSGGHILELYGNESTVQGIVVDRGGNVLYGESQLPLIGCVLVSDLLECAQTGYNYDKGFL